MAFKIYTKTGDKGNTSLIGGTRVPKHHIRIESYGTVDELNSFVGLLKDQDINQPAKDFLLEIQDRLFTIGSILASDPESAKMKIPHLEETDISALEAAIDDMQDNLPVMKSFILPGGHQTVSFCHLARCVCRRAERCVTQLSENEKVDENVIRYLNRLSDYLFVLARQLTQDLDADETPWKPRI